jgi:hypothetical protein
LYAHCASACSIWDGEVNTDVVISRVAVVIRAVIMRVNDHDIAIGISAIDVIDPRVSALPQK